MLGVQIKYALFRLESLKTDTHVPHTIVFIVLINFDTVIYYHLFKTTRISCAFSNVKLLSKHIREVYLENNDGTTPRPLIRFNFPLLVFKHFIFVRLTPAQRRALVPCKRLKYVPKHHRYTVFAVHAFPN